MSNILIRNGRRLDSNGRRKARTWRRSTNAVSRCGRAKSSFSSRGSRTTACSSSTSRRVRTTWWRAIRTERASTTRRSSYGACDRVKRSDRSRASDRLRCSGPTSSGTSMINTSLVSALTRCSSTRPRRLPFWTRRVSRFRILLTLSGPQLTTIWVIGSLSTRMCLLVLFFWRYQPRPRFVIRSVIYLYLETLKFMFNCF